MLIPIDAVLLPPNMPAGMDWSVIGHFAMLLRKLPQPCDPPIQVSRLGVCPTPCAEDCKRSCHEDHQSSWKQGHDSTECPANIYRIRDGRHRFFGSVIAGRTHIEAEVR